VSKRLISVTVSRHTTGEHGGKQKGFDRILQFHDTISMVVNRSGTIEFGTCSWNYDSWIGLVYSKKASYSAAYLKEYSAKYPTVEVDSWFYKLPTPEDALEYKTQTQPGFSFSCKLTESISLTHERNRDKEAPLIPNPGYLSAELFAQYLEAIRVLIPQIFVLELEFEYLNKLKMPNLAAFMQTVEKFINSLEKAGLRHLVPLAIETRNSNYLKREYFQFLKDHEIAHIFSEKMYLPHIYELYTQFGDLIGNRVPIRLLGGDRKEIETMTNGTWNDIVAPKADLPEIANMIGDLATGSRIVKVYLNNHYEGSAPKSIDRLSALLPIKP
jgi:uncharacterized protein YecE (DUF72 family)